MTSLETLSHELAAAVASASPAIVQVLGARRPASGVVHGSDIVVTTARAIGREDGLRVRPSGADASPIDAELVGWDPASGVAVLRTRGALDLPPPAVTDVEPRTGELVFAVARSWSNAVTAAAGIVAVVGGPLRTGRRRQIARVFRITASLHDGFAGGGIFDASGRLTGLATAAAIRGLAVGIPASIAWAAAGQVLTSGTPRRGFLGVAVQPVSLPPAQQSGGRSRALLIIGVTPSSPAADAGLLVGDLLLEVDGQPMEAPDDLLDRLTGIRGGQSVVARLLRGGEERSVSVAVADRQPR